MIIYFVTIVKTTVTTPSLAARNYKFHEIYSKAQKFKSSLNKEN